MARMLARPSADMRSMGLCAAVHALNSCARPLHGACVTARHIVAGAAINGARVSQYQVVQLLPRRSVVMKGLKPDGPSNAAKASGDFSSESIKYALALTISVKVQMLDGSTQQRRFPSETSLYAKVVKEELQQEFGPGRLCPAGFEDVVLWSDCLLQPGQYVYKVFPSEGHTRPQTRESPSSGPPAALLAPDLNPSANAPDTNEKASIHTVLTEELKELPKDELAEVIVRAVKERDQANAISQTLAKEQLQEQSGPWKARPFARPYVIDPDYIMNRVGEEMYERVEAVTAKWKPRLAYDDFTAEWAMNNYKEAEMLYNTEGRLLYLKPIPRGTWPIQDKSEVSFYCVISSALLLYRLCCLFEGLHIEVDGPEGYKEVWSAEVQHIATGEAVGFGEWKGAASIRVSNLDGPKEFFNDMLELLNLLCDEKCPHPYDGIIAGTVA